MYARCTLCAIDFSVSHGGRNDVTSHLKSKRHNDMSMAMASSTPITSLFQSQTSDQAIEAEVRWATFVAKHNLPFLSSDHATKLFGKNIDSEIAKKFYCARTKTTAIIKKALAPHFTQRVIESIGMSSGPFSLMMDESNDKTDSLA